MTRLLRNLSAHAWFLWEPAAVSILPHIGADAPTPPSDLAARPERDADGQTIPRMEMDGSLAIVPVHGGMIKKATPYEKWALGATSHEDISSDIDAAIEAGAKSILFNVDSPGGTVMGTHELANKIAALPDQGIQTFSFSDTVQASAAEYITAGVQNRLGAHSAVFGSIGTIMTAVSVAGVLERFGVDVNVIRSGPMKGAGHPLKRMTEEELAYFQDGVNSMAEEFKAHMEAHRPSFGREHMTGETFSGTKAVEIGLLDAVAGSFAEVRDAAKG